MSLLILSLFLFSGCATRKAYQKNRDRLVEKQLYEEGDQVRIQAWTDGEYTGLQYNFSAQKVMFNDFESTITTLIGALTDGIVLYGTYYGANYIKDELNDDKSNQNKSTVHVNQNDDGTYTIRADEVIFTP